MRSHNRTRQLAEPLGAPAGGVSGDSGGSRFVTRPTEAASGVGARTQLELEKLAHVRERPLRRRQRTRRQKRKHCSNEVGRDESGQLPQTSPIEPSQALGAHRSWSTPSVSASSSSSSCSSSSQVSSSRAQLAPAPADEPKTEADTNANRVERVGARQAYCLLRGERTQQSRDRDRDRAALRQCERKSAVCGTSERRASGVGEQVIDKTTTTTTTSGVLRDTDRVGAQLAQLVQETQRTQTGSGAQPPPPTSDYYSQASSSQNSTPTINKAKTERAQTNLRYKQRQQQQQVRACIVENPMQSLDETGRVDYCSRRASFGAPPLVTTQLPAAAAAALACASAKVGGDAQMLDRMSGVVGGGRLGVEVASAQTKPSIATR